MLMVLMLGSGADVGWGQGCIYSNPPLPVNPVTDYEIKIFEYGFDTCYTKGGSISNLLGSGTVCGGSIGNDFEPYYFYNRRFTIDGDLIIDIPVSFTNCTLLFTEGHGIIVNDCSKDDFISCYTTDDAFISFNNCTLTSCSSAKWKGITC